MLKNLLLVVDKHGADALLKPQPPIEEHEKARCLGSGLSH
jgi:hypothetical protein